MPSSVRVAPAPGAPDAPDDDVTADVVVDGAGGVSKRLPAVVAGDTGGGGGARPPLFPQPARGGGSDNPLDAYSSVTPSGRRVCYAVATHSSTDAATLDLQPGDVVLLLLPVDPADLAAPAALGTRMLAGQVGMRVGLFPLSCVCKLPGFAANLHMPDQADFDLLSPIVVEFWDKSFPGLRERRRRAGQAAAAEPGGAGGGGGGGGGGAAAPSRRGTATETAMRRISAAIPVDDVAAPSSNAGAAPNDSTATDGTGHSRAGSQTTIAGARREGKASLLRRTSKASIKGAALAVTIPAKDAGDVFDIPGVRGAELAMVSVFGTRAQRWSQSKFGRITTGYLVAKHKEHRHAHKVLATYDGERHSLLDTPRWACYHALVSSWFEAIVLSVIVLNLVLLTLYDPTAAEHTGRNRVLRVAEYCFLGVYIVELAVRVVADGLWQPRNFTRHAFARSTSNLLDAFVVVCGCVDVIYEQATHGEHDHACGGTHTPTTKIALPLWGKAKVCTA